MKTFVRFVCFLLAATCVFVAVPQRAFAQSTTTIDWTTLNAPSGGVLPNPSTATASDGSTTATVSYSTAANGTPFVPILDSFVSYYDPNFGGFAGSLLMNFDNSAYDPGDKLTTTVALSRSVTGLQFSITDIDASNWIDAIEVYYQDAGGTWRNAAETPAFYAASSAATRTSNATVNGWRGTASVAADQTTGNVNFTFGNTLVRGVRVVYFSYTGSGDPGAQVSGISDLTFNRAFADLSLTKTLLTASPNSGSTAIFRLTLTNAAASSLTATGVQVRDTLPAGFTYSSSTGTGTFNPATGIWTVGDLARTQSATIDISGVVTATSGAVLTNRAEVSASSQFDPDSSPANGVTTEDDYATATLTVGGARTAGTAPTLVCPNQSIVFDWDSVTWAAGTTSNSYALGTLGNIAFNLTNDGVWLNNAAFGGQSPNRQNVFTGGMATPQFALGQLVDQPNRSGRAKTTITLPEIMRGAQFRIFDVDSNPGQFADLVIVEGRYKGTSVLPALTNGVANYVIGNTAYGDGASDSNAAAGNVVVTFSEPIDTIIVSYGNHSAAPIDPGQQGIAIHDITFCRPTTTLTIDKTSRLLSDPVDFGDYDYRIPGATIEYCLVTTNTGDTRATNVVISDVLPESLIFVNESIRSGTTCSGASTIEDDDAVGADESDPVGAEYRDVGEIYSTSATLAAGDSLAIVFQARIN
ncbi:MAG: DUF11 domain-containing protein [Alteraurantiacibacter sp.]